MGKHSKGKQGARKSDCHQRVPPALILVSTLEELLERFGETLMGVNVGAGDSTVMSR